MEGLGKNWRLMRIKGAISAGVAATGKFFGLGKMKNILKGMIWGLRDQFWRSFLGTARSIGWKRKCRAC